MSFEVIDMEVAFCENDNEISCDGVELYFANTRTRLVYCEDVLIIFPIYKRKGFLLKDDGYLRYEFVDTDTGEVAELKVSIQMDDVCMRNKIYPSYISKSIEDFRNKIKNQVV